ncbi:MAG TPA: creatininase family protein [Planctomycetota bacterium]|nr:creatininase family protein [Planctomycetota bacterium]
MTDDLHSLNDMLPGEFEAHLAAGNDLAILPVGSIEHHGPHLLNGCDGYITLGKARELARLTGGVLFPMMSFCWEGATNVYSGGVGVREHLFVDYLLSVVRGVRQAGFRRIVILNSHGGNYYAMRTFAQHCLRETGIAVTTVYGTAFCAEAESAREKGMGEAGSLIGALHLMGRDDLVEDILDYTRRATEEFGDRPEVTPGPPQMMGARRLGCVGQDYNEEIRHARPDSRQTDPQAGAEVIRQIARHIAEHLDALGDYVDETEG